MAKLRLRPRFQWDYRIGCTNRIEASWALFLPNRCEREPEIGIQIALTWVQRVLYVGAWVRRVVKEPMNGKEII